MPDILIADDHPLCAAALTMAARAVDQAARIDTATTFADALVQAQARRHDLILLDLMLPDVQGFTGLTRLRALHPDTPIALVSGRDQPHIVRQAATLGAHGFLSKAATIDTMVAAIAALLAGRSWFPGDILAQGDDTPHAAIAARIASLSTAQLRVMRAIANGHQNKQIAYDLDLAEPTVKSHLSAIFRKLGVTNRTQAVLAMRMFDGEEIG